MNIVSNSINCYIDAMAKYFYIENFKDYLKNIEKGFYKGNLIDLPLININRILFLF